MPCYGCLLRLFRKISIPLSITKMVPCHAKFLCVGNYRAVLSLTLLLGAFASPASPQLSSISGLPAPPPADGATVERPDFSVKIPRPDAPARGDYDFAADTQESDNGVHKLHGHVTVELFNATFRADEAEYDENTKVFQARGHVYYRNYDQNEVIYCDSADYNTETSRGTFHHVRGYTKTKVIARPGILTTQEPFYFEGAYAEKFDEKYVLHDGFITDCRIPNPWWTLHSSLFDIVPDDRAVTRKALFRLHNVPVFYFPYFYKALKKEPRKSGFLTPEAGHSSQFGYFFGAGYYWAINRSYDATYVLQDYTSRGYAHHVDLRGKPNKNTDFNVIFYGVQDRGTNQGGTLVKAPGVSITGLAKSEFGNGWTVKGNLDYLSSFLFRQTFTSGFNEAVYSSTNSLAILTKKFDYYTFNTSASRNENFESTNANDSLIIRKLPEVEFEGRDQQIADGPVPAWVSFDSSFGLYHRVQPHAAGETGFYETNQFNPRSDFEPSLNSAFHIGSLGILPSLTMHETIYGQSLTGGTTVLNASLNRSAPELVVDFALPPIERIFKRKTFLGDELKHVIEPRITYRYVTGINSFLDTLRFDQTDLLSNTNEVEIGITNRLYAKRGSAVSEVFTWEVFQKRFFDPTFGGAVTTGQRNVVLSAIDMTGYSFLNGPRHYSPIVSIMRSNPKNGIAFQWETDYDPLLHRVTNSLLSVDVHVKKYFVSSGYTLVRPDPVVSPPANQIRGTFGYGDPNRKGLNAALSTVYALSSGSGANFQPAKLQFAIAQVTYNTDCCGFSVELRRLNFGARDDTQYRVAVSIANIGTFGNLRKQERIF